MTKFKVDICRIGYGFKTIEVEARNEKEAKEKAIDEAGGHEFSEVTAEYEADAVSKIKEEFAHMKRIFGSEAEQDF